MPPCDPAPDRIPPKPTGNEGNAPATNPYAAFVEGFARLLEDGRHLPLGGFLPAPLPPAGETAPLTLLFAPHPDDECIVGALPLRLRRELGHRVLAVAVTLGSRRDRQEARLGEMRDACAFLGFELATLCDGGLMGLHPDRRDLARRSWPEAVDLVAKLLVHHHPAMVFLPHAGDRNTTHQGTHALVMDALRAAGPSARCHVVETEFWSPMADPNVLVESTAAEVADLVAAVALHRGAVQRNPYHLRLPSWMSDNVRRGGELLGGQGGAAPDCHFATLYRRGFWDGATLHPDAEASMLATGTSLGAWFGGGIATEP